MNVYTHSLLHKYNIPGPRYTSYPAVPHWKFSNFTQEEYFDRMKETLSSDKRVSVYIHLPFCESLCTFCGCHKRITKNHAVELPYLETLRMEWKQYQQLFDNELRIAELHLGGGTPTFFDPTLLATFLSDLLRDRTDESELSFEGHPNNTSDEHLRLLYNLGFRRMSLGIQSYSPSVQKAINRKQPFSTVQKVHSTARRFGYTSISHDLVYGLPFQTLDDIHDTIEKTLTLKPERIALYSYAHVPWVKGTGQRGYDEADLPSANLKRRMYEEAKERLLQVGYIETGMDHFALPTDKLALAFKAKKLHRNFMGYTTQDTAGLIGLGMSAISDMGSAYHQNEKNLEAYQEKIISNEFPTYNGHLLTTRELAIRKLIMDIMCHFEGTIPDELMELYPKFEERSKGLLEDGLMELVGKKIRVTETGLPFVRNIAMVFDPYLMEIFDEIPRFSKTI